MRESSEIGESFLLVKISSYCTRNFAMARFYFKALFGAVTIREGLDNEGSIYKDKYVVLTISIAAHYMHEYCTYVYSS